MPDDSYDGFEDDAPEDAVWDLTPEELDAIGALELALDQADEEAAEDWRADRKRRYGSPARASAHRVGARGEDLACELIRELGMEIIARNYLGPHGELDIVARDGGVLCFVEVKARRHNTRTRPADAVSAKKRAAIARTAARYLRELGSPPLTYRFDVIEVVLHRDGRRLRDIRYWPAEFAAPDRPPRR